MGHMVGDRGHMVGDRGHMVGDSRHYFFMTFSTKGSQYYFFMTLSKEFPERILSPKRLSILFLHDPFRRVSPQKVLNIISSWPFPKSFTNVYCPPKVLNIISSWPFPKSFPNAYCPPKGSQYYSFMTLSKEFSLNPLHKNLSNSILLSSPNNGFSLCYPFIDMSLISAYLFHWNAYKTPFQG
jgi:hypothetical protein